MRLFIAEKPSLARAIADALPGPAVRGRDAIRCGPSDVVGWCVGHILETAPPEAYGDEFKAWSLAHLPIVPREWKLQPSNPELLASLRRLLKQADHVVHAGDPDREGQLLVDEVLAFLGYRGRVDRLIVRDLTPAAVREQIQALEPNAKYRSLSDSALARQRADWLFGMNMTRLYTLLGRQAGYDGVLSVGRVQTPLLGLIVRRDRAIESFRPTPYFTVVATLRTDAGETFRATWVPGTEHAAHLDSAKRLLRRELADAVRETAGKAGRLTSRSDEPTRQPPPLPYDLADLQIDAGKRLGLSAQQVLDACQSLYEGHQLTTYPRSDCSHLPTAHHAQAPAVIAAAARHAPALAPLLEAADLSLRSKAWDDAKVTAHHAIIPTPAGGPPRDLRSTEAAIYDLIVRRYVAQFYPPFAYVQSELAIDLGGHAFRATGRQVTAPGWKAVLSRAEPEADATKSTAEDAASNPSLPPVRTGDPLRAADVAVAEKKTQPPKPFTDDSLVEAMCHVGQFVSDPDIKKILSKADGIGTSATRGAIIETLFTRGYVERKQKTIVSTPTGRALIDALPEVATTPDMTALWEAAMRVILEGRQPLDGFLARVEAQLRHLVAEAVAGGPIAVAQRAAAAAPTNARPPRSSRSNRTAARSRGR